ARSPLTGGQGIFPTPLAPRGDASMSTTATSSANRNKKARRRYEALLGLSFAAPALLITIALFVVPLALAFWMSANNWPLIGSPTLNFPDNYTGISSNKLFMGSIVFTLKYTVVVTVLYLVI